MCKNAICKLMNCDTWSKPQTYTILNFGTKKLHVERQIHNYYMYVYVRT